MTDRGDRRLGQSGSHALGDLDEVIRGIVDDPATSFWLQTALNTALRRDPLDAANDASLLHDVLRRRSEALLGGACSERTRSLT